MTVLSSVTDGLGHVVLSAPPLNILTRSVLADLRTQLEQLAADRSVRAVLLSAEGKHFSAGADVAEHLPPDYEKLIPEFVQTVIALDVFPVPTVAAVQGRCLGAGFELVQVADIVVAAETASFGQPEIALGVLPPAACAVLPDCCPLPVAARIVFTGDPLEAAEAKAAGLVTEVVPEGELEAAALELVGRITRHSAAALRAGKRMLKEGRSHARAVALEQAGKLYVDTLMHTEDAEEGLRAFIEKRKPTWKHR